MKKKEKLILALCCVFAAIVGFCSGGCTKSQLPFQHQEGQHYEIWATSKVETITEGHYCPINIVGHQIDTLYWNSENPDTRWMLNSAHQDSVVDGTYFYTVCDSLIATGTTYGPLK
jgi:hypothetical protein